jgi:hypothetical protein
MLDLSADHHSRRADLLTYAPNRLTWSISHILSQSVMKQKYSHNQESHRPLAILSVYRYVKEVGHTL